MMAIAPLWSRLKGAFAFLPFMPRVGGGGGKKQRVEMAARNDARKSMHGLSCLGTPRCPMGKIVSY